jgi:hypothetical protein
MDRTPSIPREKRTTDMSVIGTALVIGAVLAAVLMLAAAMVAAARTFSGDE